MKRLAILLSGRGSNFEAIADRIKAGELLAKIEVVVSNVDSAPALEKARQRGLNTIILNSQELGKEKFEQTLVKILKDLKVDLICLAGFMKILSPSFIHKFPNQILNIHPSILPAFSGLDPQKQALHKGVKFSGCTVHFVNEGIDAGPIVMQAVVPVFESDNEQSLSNRILVEEHQLYAKAIDLVLRDKIRIDKGRVIRSGS